MRKSIVLLAAALVLAAGVIAGGFVFTVKYGADVKMTEETLAGDSGAAAGLKAEFRADSGRDLHWETAYNYADGTADTDFVRGNLPVEKPVNPYKFVRFSGSEDYRIRLGSRVYTPEDEELHESFAGMFPSSGMDSLVVIQEESAASGYTDCTNRLLILPDSLGIYELPVKVTLSSAMTSKGKKSWLVPDPVPLGEKLRMVYPLEGDGEYTGMSLSPDHSIIALFSVRGEECFLELVDAAKMKTLNRYSIFPAADEMKYAWGDDGCLVIGSRDDRLALLSGEGDMIYSGEAGEGFYEEFFGDAIDVRRDYAGDYKCNLCPGTAAACSGDKVALMQYPECAVFDGDGLLYRGILRSSISMPGVTPVPEENNLLFER